MEPVVTIGGVHLQCGQTQGYRNVAIRGGYRIHSEAPTRFTGTRSADAKFETRNGIAERLVKILRMLRERMEEVQLTMVTEAKEHRQPHPFRIGDSVFLDIRLLPVGYANVNSTANNSANSRKFQHPYAGLFTILKSAAENAFILDILAY